MKNKHVKVIDYILLIGSVIILFGVLYNYYENSNEEPITLSPENGGVSENRFVLFEFTNAQTIFIDDNMEFSSPEIFEVGNNFVINLEPGNYYWKIEGNRESEIRQFSVESRVSLEIRKSESEGKYSVVNAGTEDLDVEVYESGKSKENIVLDVYSQGNEEGEKFIGGQSG